MRHVTTGGTFKLGSRTIRMRRVMHENDAHDTYE